MTRPHDLPGDWVDLRVHGGSLARPGPEREHDIDAPPRGERKQGMDEGAFDQNFTWFEWGFVSPEDVPAEERTSSEGSADWAMTSRVVERWDEDHRWPT